MNLQPLIDRKPKLVQFALETRVKCDVHGPNVSSYFLANGVPAQYVCSHCWNSQSAKDGK